MVKVDPTQLSFRRLASQDVPAITEIEARSFPSPWSERLFLNELEHHFSHFLVATYNEEIIGYAGFWLVVDEAHLTNFAVAPEYRRQGVGLTLMRALLNLAYEVGARKATLEVRVSNTDARRLYEKLGFQGVALRKKYYADTLEDAIIMWLNPLERSDVMPLTPPSPQRGEG